MVASKISNKINRIKLLYIHIDNQYNSNFVIVLIFNHFNVYIYFTDKKIIFILY